ncbi:hypothetical protein ANCCEY_04834 [Ancylostoma ceylanicum]|uniref:Uncharacterized protein n=1 Tax=Ancylostoma ceylanicum TaxID=53326 RepID=A0A0D6M135_9BILA|nr:hypothetical protein ANCCEY_04834 [Ancylostoma ceylanicum]
MNSFYYLLCVLFVTSQRSLASYPSPIVEEAPAVAIAPEPIHVEPIHVAPAPAPIVAPVEYHHHNPRTEIRNIATHYKKESGHRSDTVMVSGDDHFAGGLEFYPHHAHGHMLGEAGYALPLHRQKLASKKAARAHKSFEKKKN